MKITIEVSPEIASKLLKLALKEKSSISELVTKLIIKLSTKTHVNKYKP